MSYELKDYLDAELVVIDSLLAQQAVAPIVRPLHAALYFVEEYIIEIKGGTKEDYFEQEWFTELYQLIKDWYLKRYGKNLNQYKPESLKGVVMIFGTPFQLKIPLTFSQIETPGESAWICFPIKVHEHESPLSWLIQPPNLQVLAAEEREVLDSAIREVAAKTRSIHNELMTADLPTTELKKFAESVLAHISKGVEDICSLSEARLSIAIWEVYFAVEKAIKVFLYQKVGKPKCIHSLEDLIKEAEQHGLPLLDRHLLSMFPNTKEAIMHRYNELTPPTIEEAVNMYQSALQIILHCAGPLTRSVVFNDVRFLMKMPPWLKHSAD